MKHGRGYVYDLYYHIVWCVKYRHKILKGNIKEELIKIINELCKNNNYELVEINTDLDHVHLLISCKPQHYIPDIIKRLKVINSQFHLRLDKRWKIHLYCA